MRTLLPGFASDEIMLSPFSKNGYHYEILDYRPIPIEFEDGYYTIGIEELGIYIGERTMKELKNSFYSCLDFLWRFYYEEVDGSLTENAKQLKRNISLVIRRK